ncbi:MAG: hypothetical protein V1932_05670 [Chloroflexota bacterium]
MEWQVIIALALAIPILLIPVGLVWYTNISGIYAAIKESRARREAQTMEPGELVAVRQRVDK